MIKSLNNFFDNNSDNLPKIIAITTLITDIACLFYINKYWLTNKLQPIVTKMMTLQGILKPNQSDLEQTTAVLANSLGTMFFFFILGHAIIYALVFLKKNWALNYVRRYVLMTVVLTLFEFFIVFKDSKVWFLILLAITLSYTFTFLGLRAFKKNQEQ